MESRPTESIAISRPCILFAQLQSFPDTNLAIKLLIAITEGSDWLRTETIECALSNSLRESTLASHYASHCSTTLRSSVHDELSGSLLTTRHVEGIMYLGTQLLRRLAILADNASLEEALKI